MTLMMIAVPAMQGIYEVLAFVVALFFPVALLTWLVIDKFMPTPDGLDHAVRQPSGRDRRSHVHADRSHPGA